MDPNNTHRDPSEHNADEPFGAALLRCFAEEGLPLSTMSYATIQSLKTADREQAVRILRAGTSGGLSYGFIQRLKKDTPERIAERLVVEYRLAAQQMTMMMLFMC